MRHHRFYHHVHKSRTKYNTVSLNLARVLLSFGNPFVHFVGHSCFGSSLSDAASCFSATAYAVRALLDFKIFFLWLSWPEMLLIYYSNAIVEKRIKQYQPKIKNK